VTARTELVTDLLLSFLLLAAMCACLTQWDREGAEAVPAARSTCAQISAASE
jgi:hypothetical protein